MYGSSPSTTSRSGPGRPHGPSEPEQFLEFLAVFEATYSAVKTTSPRFAQMVDQQVHQFLQGHLPALLEPLSSDVALEVDQALRKASESDVDTLEWVGRMIQQLCHPDFQELLTALRERKGCVALETTGPHSSGFGYMVFGVGFTMLYDPVVRVREPPCLISRSCFS